MIGPHTALPLRILSALNELHCARSQVHDRYALVYAIGTIALILCAEWGA